MLNRTAALHNLGCKVNAYETEVMQQMLSDAGYTIVPFTEKADVYIINRENVPWLIDESGYPFDYDMIVVDELSSFKNWQAKRFKALMKVRPTVKRIVGLTGTPSSNGLMDLFAEFKVLDMGERLGRFIGQYRTNYFKPDRMNGPIVYTYSRYAREDGQVHERQCNLRMGV